jgi:hypothetical protein
MSVSDRHGRFIAAMEVGGAPYEHRALLDFAKDSVSHKTAPRHRTTQVRMCHCD